MLDSCPECKRVCNKTFKAPFSTTDAKCKTLTDAIITSGANAVFASLPCQPTSSANIHKMKADPRATMGPTVVQNIINSKVPLILLENNARFVSSPRFKIIKKQLLEQGYDVSIFNVEWSKVRHPAKQKKVHRDSLHWRKVTGCVTNESQVR